ISASAWQSSGLSICPSCRSPMRWKKSPHAGGPGLPLPAGICGAAWITNSSEQPQLLGLRRRARVKAECVGFLDPVPVFADPYQFAGTRLSVNASTKELFEDLISFGV